MSYATVMELGWAAECLDNNVTWSDHMTLLFANLFA